MIRGPVRAPLASAFWTAVLLAALLTATGGAGEAAGGPEALVPALRQALDHYLAARSAVEHISAVSLSVSFRGEPSTVNVTAGRTRWGGDEPVPPDALFQTGSNTKAFTAVILLQLEAEGRLSIDDTVGKWLPQYPAWKDVSIRRLLNMTARIPTYDETPYFIKALGSGADTDWTAPELVAIVYPEIGAPPPRGPGWVYSNTNFIVAQMIIERATGDSYANELGRRLFEPLGLRSTFYDTNRYPPEVAARMVAGYWFNPAPELSPAATLMGRDVSGLNVSWAQGAGGIVSTMADLAKWARALYEGPVLAPRQRDEMLSIVSTATGAPIARTTLGGPRGFGLAVVQQTLAATGMLWFYEGETFGYRALYAYAPARGTIIAVALNSFPASDEIGQLMLTVYGILHRAGRA